MKRFRVFAMILALAMLCGCGSPAAPAQNQTLQAQSAALRERLPDAAKAATEASDQTDSAPAPAQPGSGLPAGYDVSALTPWDWDSRAIDEAIAHTAALLASADGSDRDWAEIAAAYQAVMDEYDEYSDLALLYSLACDLDPRDTEARTASREFDDLDPYDRVAELIGQLLDSPYWEDFLALTENQRLWALYGYIVEDDDTPASESPETQLTDRFDDLYYTMNDLEVTYGDEAWTWNRFLAQADELSNADYYALGELLERNENAALGQVQVDLINLRNRQARSWGYDNYYAMAWEAYYYRDYTMEEYQTMLEAIMNTMPDVYARLSRRSYDWFYDGQDGYDWDLSGFYAYAATDERLPEDLRAAFRVFEYFSVAVFTVEYLARIWTADLLYPDSGHPRLKYLFSFMAVMASAGRQLSV